MEAVQRRALRVLRMVHEFHKQGFQLLRIAPGLSPSGCHWRCDVTPRSNNLCSQGALIGGHKELKARYTSGQDNEYFGWTDAKDDSVVQLAEKFHERFPEILEQSRGDDWEYAGWYVRMLGFAEQGFFPIAYADYTQDCAAGFLPLSGCQSALPLPPPGEADE